MQVHSFSIRPDDEQNIARLKEIKAYTSSNGINFSSFVLKALAFYWEELKDGKN